MSEMTYEQYEIRPQWFIGRMTDGTTIINGTDLTPDEQRRLAEWLLMDPPSEPVKVGDPVRWNEWKWQVIGFHRDRTWLVRDGDADVLYRNPLTTEVEVIR